MELENRDVDFLSGKIFFGMKEKHGTDREVVERAWPRVKPVEKVTEGN